VLKAETLNTISDKGILMVENVSAPMQDDKGYITFDQVKAMVEVCDDDRDKLFIKFLFFTGRRINEVVGKYAVTPYDINFADSLVTFSILKKNPRRKKKDKAGNVIVTVDEQAKLPPVKRTIPVFPALLEEVKRYIAKYNVRPHDAIFDFTDRTGYNLVNKIALRAAEVYPMLFETAEKTLKKGTIKYVVIGRKPIHNHSFRHGFSVHMAKHTGGTLEDARHLQLLLQHSDIRITQNYLKYSPNDTKKMLEKAFGKGD
jgi:integrase